MFAASTTTVCCGVGEMVLDADVLATAAPPIDTTMPIADMHQKGTISFTRWDRPPFPQTHFRLR